MANYIRVSEAGSILENRSGMGVRLEAPWIEIPREGRALLNRDLYQIRWDGEKLVEKSQIQLSVGIKSWPADGKTPNLICIRGDIDPDTKVRVLVNDQEYLISKDDDAELVTSQAGQFVIRMDDPLYYCTPTSITIVATEGPDEN